MKTIKTRLHAFSLDLRISHQKEEWDSIKARAERNNVLEMHSWGGSSHYFGWVPKGGIDVELETAHPFSNQWNTAPIPGVSEKGIRVFDLAYDYFPHGDNKNIRRGHYLEITDEMHTLRHETMICGYCGAKYGPYHKPVWPQDGFCSKCLGSEYLKFEDLYLLRLLPVAEHLPRREPLTNEELARLEPLYREAQRKGSDERTTQRIQRRRQLAVERIAKAKEKVEEAIEESNARLWCLDRGLLRAEDNLIFYPHTGRFCFGWREPMAGDDLDQLLNHISEFRWIYEIECADGRTLSGNEG